MATYYDVLQVTPTATLAEIETAYEAQYNRWRRLVTHHDPDMVNRANQALQVLERLRVTLVDPAKRAAYDESIGLQGLVGGLAVLQARPQTTRPAPPPPRPRVEPQTPHNLGAGPSVNAWVCPRCQTANAIHTRFCKQCGHKLGHECPQCGDLIEVAAQHCTRCGVDVERFVQQQQWEAEAQRRQQLQAEQEATKRAELESRRSAWARKLGFGPGASKAAPALAGAVIGLLSSATLVQATMTDLRDFYVQAPVTVASTAPIVGLIVGGLLGIFVADAAENSFSLGEIGGAMIAGVMGGVAQAILFYILIAVVDKGIAYTVISTVFILPVIAIISSIFSVTTTSLLAGLVWGIVFGLVRMGLWGVAQIGRSRAG